MQAQILMIDKIGYQNKYTENIGKYNNNQL